uniref:hypothetical protein n=1 Tax=Candidatus Tripitaka californicus TaxID=3367616 RepID=UPI004026C265
MEEAYKYNSLATRRSPGKGPISRVLSWVFNRAITCAEKALVAEHQGYSIGALPPMLGHSSISRTMIYCQVLARDTRAFCEAINF